MLSPGIRLISRRFPVIPQAQPTQIRAQVSSISEGLCHLLTCSVFVHTVSLIKHNYLYSSYKSCHYLCLCIVLTVNPVHLNYGRVVICLIDLKSYATVTHRSPSGNCTLRYVLFMACCSAVDIGNPVLFLL